jgi:hypothetical protein
MYYLNIEGPWGLLKFRYKKDVEEHRSKVLNYLIKLANSPDYPENKVDQIKKDIALVSSAGINRVR